MASYCSMRLSKTVPSHFLSCNAFGQEGSFKSQLNGKDAETGARDLPFQP